MEDRVKFDDLSFNFAVAMIDFVTKKDLNDPNYVKFFLAHDVRIDGVMT